MNPLHPLLLLGAAALLATPSLSQTTQYFVSPRTAATAEGSGSNSFPFTNSTMRRYMQIHSDLPTRVMQIRALAWRHNTGTTNYTGMRVMDVELFMGRSRPYDQCSFFFDDNYVGNSRKVAVKRKTVNVQGSQAATPSPFGPSIKCDAPVLRLPIEDWAWELVVYSNGLNGKFGTIDAEVGSKTVGSYSSQGKGCRTGTQSATMNLQLQVYDHAGTLQLMFSGANYPPNSPAFVMLGVLNPNLNVPGLCTTLQTDLVFGIFPIGVSQSNGDLNRQASLYYYRAASGNVLIPNPGPVAFHAQILCVDSSQFGLPLALSDGVRIQSPAPDTSKLVEVTRLFNNSGGTTAKESAIFTTSSVGYGLPTRFEY